MGSTWSLIKASLWSHKEITQKMIIDYQEFIKKCVKYSFFIIIIFLPLPIIGFSRHYTQIIGLYSAIAGLLITLWTILAFPIRMIRKYGFEDIKYIKNTVEITVGVLFFALIFSLYCYFIPVWNDPSDIPLVFFTCIFLSFVFSVFGIGTNPKIALGVLFFIFSIVNITYYICHLTK